jgi:hypothetical protein
MVSGNRSISSDFIFGLIIAVFGISIIITIMIFFPEQSNWKLPDNNQIMQAIEGKIVRIESELISVDTDEGIVNTTCGLCFSNAGTTNTNCKIGYNVELTYKRNMIEEHYCINAFVE